MGFSEDERIRCKNRKHNKTYQEALELYEGLKAFGYGDDYIAKYANFAIPHAENQSRIEVYNTIISIVKANSNEKVNCS